MYKTKHNEKNGRLLFLSKIWFEPFIEYQDEGHSRFSRHRCASCCRGRQNVNLCFSHDMFPSWYMFFSFLVLIKSSLTGEAVVVPEGEHCFCLHQKQRARILWKKNTPCCLPLFPQTLLAMIRLWAATLCEREFQNFSSKLCYRVSWGWSWRVSSGIGKVENRILILMVKVLVE